MKKHLLLLAVALCSAFYSQAQWVPVQPAFATYIRTYVSASAVSGNLLDTTSTAITSLRNLTMNNTSPVTDITGIQYFDSLENLYVSFNLQFIPALPAGLKTAQFTYAQSYITSPLPTGLVALNIERNQFTSFPALPATLRKFILKNFTNLVPLPVLPDSLQHLEICYTRPGNALPAIPSTVTYLDLSGTVYGPVNSWQFPLDTFHCDSCVNITSLPDLPSNMLDLSVNGSPVTSMGTVPNRMFWLDLSSTLLPTVSLPDSVENLFLNSMNFLGPLDYIDTLFVGDFYASHSPLANIGPLLGRLRDYSDFSWFTITATDDSIRTIPPIQTHFLFSLNLSYNPISSLPSVPLRYDSITHQYWSPFDQTYTFNLSYCQLTDVNPNFFTSSNYNTQPDIDLSYNQLTEIYSTVGGISSNVNFSHNQITDYYANLDNWSVDLSYNHLQCLPLIGASMDYLDVSNNPIDCIPNIPNTSFYCTPYLDVCVAGNTHNCPVLPVTGGHVYNDANQNALFDSTEALMPAQTVTLLPDGFLHVSDSNGLYKFNVALNTNYTLRGLANYPYRRVTTAPATVHYVALGITDTTHNIGVYEQPNVNDLITRITPNVEARPGFNHYYNVMVRNEGTTVQNGNVVFYFDPSLIYVQSWPAGTVTGNSVTWPLTSLRPLQNFNASVNFIIPATVPLGNRITAGAYALGNTPDTTLADNHDTIEQIAIGSYDPNDKQVFPAEGVVLEQLQTGGNGNLEYLIRFQNTGSASAINIRVEDTLNARLDLTTFELLNSSHPCTYTIENRVLKVLFNNINLPDSGSDERLSHGFFRYRIRPVADIHAYEHIPNTAYIYFDFNDAIVTNTATSIVNSVFAAQPFSHQLCTGEHLLLYAKPAIPVVSQQWYKDGIPTGITTDSLFIDSATSAAIGSYTLHIVTDTTVYISQQATVFIYSPAPEGGSVSIRFSLGNTIGDTIQLCSTQNATYSQYFTTNNLSGLPAGTFYNWSINGIIAQNTNSNYLYTNSRTWHTGDRIILTVTYPCINKPFADTLIVKVSTGSALQVVDIVPDTPHVCPGQRVTFTTNSLHSNSNVTWYKNGISSGTGVTYTFSNLVPADQIKAYASVIQDYGCSVIANGYDTTHIIFDSTVHLSPPVLSLPYSSYPICADTLNQLNSGTSFTSNIAAYLWWLNGQLIANNTSVYRTDSLQQGDIVQYAIAYQTCTTDTFISSPLIVQQDTIERDASIIISSDTICPQISVKGKNVTNAYTHSWKINGINQGNYSSISFVRSELHADTIIYKVTFNRSCLPATLSDTLILPPHPKPYRNLLPLQASQPVFCTGTQVTFTNLNATESGLKWFKNGVALSASNYLSYTATMDTAACTIQLAYPETTCYKADTLSITVVPGQVPATYAHISYTPGTVCGQQEIAFSIATDASYYSGVWYLNNHVTSYSRNYAVANLSEGSLVKVVVQAGCNAVSSFTDSVIIHLTNQTPSASITSSYPALCDGNTQNIFLADGLYLGSAPMYQWYKNGLPVGDNNYQYADNNLQNNDRLYCRVTSNNPCVSTAIAISDTVTMYTGNAVTPAVTITASAQSTCGAQPLTFTAQPDNGGNAPVYRWSINGNTITGQNAPVFSHAGFSNNDTVQVALFSSAPCSFLPVVYSNPIPLTVNQPNSATINQTLCNGQQFDFYGAALTAAGDYQHTLVNSAGCDSVVTLHIIVTQPTTADLSNSICNGEQFDFYGTALTAAGNYQHTLSNSAGCDSVVTLHLAVMQPTTADVSNSICNGEQFDFYGTALTAAGDYQHTLSNSAGCDSVVTLHLAVMQPTTADVSNSICNGQQYDFYGTTLTATGDYQHTLTNSAGCDSVVNLSLQVFDNSSTVIDTAIIQGNSILLPWGTTVSTPGAYSDTLQSSTGCDSVVTVNLSVISGISALNSSSYLHLNPNPAHNQVNLTVSSNFVGREYVLTNVLGQVIITGRVQQTNTTISTSTLPAGLYLLRAGDVVKRLVKE